MVRVRFQSLIASTVGGCIQSSNLPNLLGGIATRLNFSFVARRSPSVVLTDMQIQSFRENGFLTLDSISTPDEVTRIRTIFEQLLRAKAGFKEGALFDLMSANENDAAPKLLEIMLINDINDVPQPPIYRRSPQLFTSTQTR